jgi:hypothetical protein
MKRTIFIFVFISAIGTSIFSQTRESVTVWGWTSDGKVAVTEDQDTGMSGARTTRAFIFDTVNDTVLWENSATEIPWEDDYDRVYPAFIDNFRRIAGQQYAIEIEPQYIARKNLIQASFDNGRINNRYYINIDVVPRGSASELFYDNLESYSVNVTSGAGQRKTILTERRGNEPLFGEAISVYGYSLSPDNGRALIIIKVEYFYMEGGYRYIFTGCNLRVGL